MGSSLQVVTAEDSGRRPHSRGIAHSTFLRKEQPSFSLARPPVGSHSMTLPLPQSTTVCAWLYTVVICKHPGHFTSMKKLFGDWIMRLSLCFVFSSFKSGFSRSISMVPCGQVVYFAQIAWPTALCFEPLEPN